MTLDQIPIEKLRTLVGKSVRSLKTNTKGVLTFISESLDGEDYAVDVDWENGCKSEKVWHFWCNNIELIEE